MCNSVKLISLFLVSQEVTVKTPIYGMSDTARIKHVLAAEGKLRDSSCLHIFLKQNSSSRSMIWSPNLTVSSDLWCDRRLQRGLRHSTANSQSAVQPLSTNARGTDPSGDRKRPCDQLRGPSAADFRNNSR